MTFSNILIAAGFIGFGALMIVSGIRKKKRCAGKTIGRITGIKESTDIDSDGSNSYSYTPEFEYEVNGQIYHSIGNTAYNKKRKIKIGGEIKVFYNPDDPSESYTKGGWMIAPLLGLIAIGFGILFIITAL